MRYITKTRRLGLSVGFSPRFYALRLRTMKQRFHWRTDEVVASSCALASFRNRKFRPKGRGFTPREIFYKQTIYVNRKPTPPVTSSQNFVLRELLAATTGGREHFDNI
jgi:hypothetical protein